MHTKYCTAGIVPQLVWHALSTVFFIILLWLWKNKHDGAHLVDYPRVSRLWIRVCVLLHTLFHSPLNKNPYEALLYKSTSSSFCSGTNWLPIFIHLHLTTFFYISDSKFVEIPGPLFPPPPFFSSLIFFSPTFLNI